jgi:hypothetical protein
MNSFDAVRKWKQDNGWHSEQRCEESFIAGFRAAREEFKSQSIVEIAVDNASVSEYIKHWEGRALAAEKKLESMVKDDPEMDDTDFAHPAWWRGFDFGFQICINHVNRILDGKATKDGTCTEPWQSLRLRLFDVRQMLGIAEAIMQMLPGSNQKFRMLWLQWYKIRRDFQRRMDL